MPSGLSRNPLPFLLRLALVGLVGTPASLAAQGLEPLSEYRSRLDVEPRVQLRTIAERCAALHGRMAVWMGAWDPQGAAEHRRQATLFRSAAVRSRTGAGASADEAARAVDAAVEAAAGLYGRRVGGGAPTAPALEADDLIQGDVAVCRSMLDVLGEG